jgi:hypothetical protein
MAFQDLLWGWLFNMHSPPLPEIDKNNDKILPPPSLDKV